MPAVNIERLGTIQYEQLPLPEGVKGKTISGLPQAPIIITPSKLPQAKLEHIVAHEVGHRNALRIFDKAARDDPKILNAPGVNSATVRWLEDEGVNPRELQVKSPVIRHMIDTAPRNEYVNDEVVAGEIVAEAFALSMTGEQKLPASIEQVFEGAARHNSEANLMPLLIGGGLLLGIILAGRR